MRRSGRSTKFVVLAVIAVLAVLGGAVGPWVYNEFIDTSAKDRIEADPPPRLFPDSTIAPIGTKIAGATDNAHELMRGWWASHDNRPHDLAFEKWVEATLPGPPSAAARKLEVQQVQALAPQRTPTGVVAATWLEEYGKKDVWKLYAHDEAEVLPAARGEVMKEDVKAMLSMAKDVADRLGLKYRQSAPYVLHPQLRTDHTVTPNQVCPCSYPSRHAAGGAAARTFLSPLDPHREPEYRWMESQIAYSRIYMAGHVSSDITGGALLGDMIGEYFRVTRHP